MTSNAQRRRGDHHRQSWPRHSANQLPLLFSRFVRTREARESRAPGLGLGLYITKGLVEAHGGRLWAESVPGEMTTFHVTLPRAERAPESRSEADAHAPS